MQRTHRMLFAPLPALLLALLLEAPALAVDGVIEINAARAAAGGVTASDTPGYPVTIDASGSYVLTSDLVVSDPSKSGIQITTDRVTLDMNGFGVIGTGSQNFGTYGIDGLNETTVRNGSVKGFWRGLELEFNCRLEGVTSKDNDDAGIYCNSTSVVTHCIAENNGGWGILVGPSSSVTHNSARFNDSTGIVATGATVIGNASNNNGAFGIQGGDAATVLDNGASQNTLDGINVSHASLVRGNTADGNLRYGLNLASTSAYVDNVVRTTVGSTGTVSGGVNRGGNTCDGGACP